MLYTVEERERVQDRLLELAAADDRIVAAAVVGSMAEAGGDRWSDIDLTFAVADDHAVETVLDDWTDRVIDDLDGLHLFDLVSGALVYRVFLLPGGLQLDVSFSPAARFRATSSRFRLVFGQVADSPPPTPRSAEDIFGWAVAYAREARACIERQRWWQADHSVAAVRDHALDLACRRRGLRVGFGRGYDDLPEDLLADFTDARARSLERDELLRALARAVDLLLRESGEVAIAGKAEPRIREWLVKVGS